VTAPESLALRAECARIESGPLRVLVVHNRYRSSMPSGENDVVDTEVAALRELGHDVRSYQRASDEIDTLRVTERISLPVRAIYSRSDVAAVRDLLTTHRPDVVHVHNLNPLISPAVIPVVHRARVPVVMSVHNHRLECANGLFFRDGAECRLCAGRRFSSPAVRHACYRDSRAQSLTMATTLAMHRANYLSVDRFIAPSPTIAGFLSGLGVPATRVTVKPNTVPDPGPPTVVPSGGFVFVGRLDASKGASLLVEAWLRQPEGELGRLTIVGDGPERAAIEQMVGDRRDVVMLGHLPTDGVADQMMAHAVTVVPSISTEAFGRVITQAMAHGRPVVATRVGSFAEIVDDAGWVTEPTADALAGALRQAASSDLAAAGARARARYEAVYTPDVVHRALVDTYREVAGSARLARRTSEM
jgi:glycosyltransferase involved in cell wall biosynthesis